MAMHHTEVSLHNIKKWNIRAYQLEETSQDLYLVASLTIPLTLPPCMALSQRRTVWCLRGENKDGAHGKRDLSSKKQLLLKLSRCLMENDCNKESIMYLQCGKEDTQYVSANSCCFACLTLLWLPLLPLLSPSFHFSALTFPIPQFFVLSASFTSVIPHFLPPLSFISFYLLSPFCLLSSFLLSAL